MEQVLFVLNDGKISQWNLSRGKLEAGVKQDTAILIASLQESV